MPKTEKVLLTPLEVAQLLGIPRNALYVRLANNEIPGQLRWGGRWLVRRAVLESWLRGELEVSA